MKRFLLLAGSLLLGACAAGSPTLANTTTPTAVVATAGLPTSPEITVVAHRCLGGVYTENTIDACVQAVAEGSTYLEGDVQWTSTETAVSIHDFDLRAFGEPTVKIKDVSFTSAAQHVSDERNNLTLLTQVRDLVQITGVKWILEPKVVPTAEEWIGLDSRLKPIKNQVTISSFDPKVVAEAIRRGYHAALNTYADVPSPPAGTDMVVQRASDIDAATVSTLRSKGIPTACFSCNDATSWASMKSKGVVYFITDHRNEAQDWVDTH